ncbi:alpha/beta hydrolase [Nocardia sp. NPDC057668]|uniref:alpha/beta hydrolase n=1 Tax=Nocardia sp. NPDC057668 TaxID=3346202 RepID=UPI00366B482B
MLDDPDLLDFVRGMRESYWTSMPDAGAPDPVGDVRRLAIPATEPERCITVRAYRPLTDADRLPVMVFVHGGGFISGDLDTHDVLCRALANRAELLVVAVDWRLAPEHRFPAGLEDVLAVLDWVGDNSEELRADTTRLVLCGDSAGGTLTAAATAIARDRRHPRVAGQVLFYPSLCAAMDTASWKQLGDKRFPPRELNRLALQAYLPDGVSTDDPRVSPLRGDHAGLPPTLILVGEHDPLLDENLAYAQALLAAGVPVVHRVVPGAEHGFAQFFKDTDTHRRGESALADAVSFLRDVTAIR